MIRILTVAVIVELVIGVALWVEPEKDKVDDLSIINSILFVTLIVSITNYPKETKFHEIDAKTNCF